MIPRHHSRRTNSADARNTIQMFSRPGRLLARLNTQPPTFLTVLGLTVAIGLLLAPSASAAVAPAPAWQIESLAQPSNFAPGDSSGHDLYVVTATNSGALETNGESVVMTDTLPAGMTATEVEFFAQPFSEGIGGINIAPFGVCTTVPLKCEFPGPFIESLLGHPIHLQPNQKLQMVVHVEVGTTEGQVTNEAEVSGGGAQSVSATSQNEVTSQPTPFGLQETTDVTALDGSRYTQAGGHPYEMTTTANLNTEFAPYSNRFSPVENFASPEEVKDIKVNFPAGLIGNPWEFHAARLRSSGSSSARLAVRSARSRSVPLSLPTASLPSTTWCPGQGWPPSSAIAPRVSALGR